MYHHDETQVLAELLNVPAFAAFYEAERSKIRGQVYWHEDKTLAEETASTETFSDRPGLAVIHLPHIPATTNDAFSVAHELLHLKLDAEGFPVVHTQQSDPSIRNIARSLANMFSDPVINECIGSYGFDLRTQVEHIAGISIRILEKLSGPPNRRARIQWVLETVGHVLEYEVATGDTGVGDYQRWFAQQFSNLGREVAKRLEPIRAMGWNTPEKQVSLLQTLIKLYDLSKYGIVLVDQR